MTGEAVYPARIADIRDEAEGVKSFALARTDGGDWPAWTPGAHVDVALGGGLNRQYSLHGDPADPSYLHFAVLREPASRGGSAALHDTLRTGDPLDVIAGGIGITPLLAMARALDVAGKDWHLLYGGRSRASMAFLDVLQAYGDRVTVRPQDEFGLLDLAGFLGPHTPGTVAYCCGPEPLILAVEAACASWPEEALQIERFRPKEQELPMSETSFEVELRKSGMVVTIPADKSIAEALDAAGVHIPRSCNEGTCGTCITRVLEGLPDHRDSFLRPKARAQNNKILVCCSRSLSARLVLDA